MKNKPNECDIVVKLTIPCVPNCKESFLLIISNYLSEDCFDEGLVMVDEIQMINEVYTEEREES